MISLNNFGWKSFNFFGMINRYFYPCQFASIILINQLNKNYFEHTNMYTTRENPNRTCNNNKIQSKFHLLVKKRLERGIIYGSFRIFGIEMEIKIGISNPSYSSHLTEILIDESNPIPTSLSIPMSKV